MEDLTSVFNSLDSLLQTVDLTGVTADDNNFVDLPDGYYLCEVVKAKLTESKSTHFPMVTFQYKVVEDGIGIDDDGNNFQIKAKNRQIFINYVLKDEASTKRFVRDMLKFEGDKEGEPLLSKEYFVNSELIENALDILTGSRIYIMISTTEKDGQKNTWKNPISWKRAKSLELNN